MPSEALASGARPGLRPDPMLPVRYRVVGTQRELADTVTLALEPVDEPLEPFSAGQFNMLWAFGAGEVPISVSGDPTVGGPLLHTIRAVGAATTALCALEVGEMVGVRGPFGSDWGVDGARGQDVVVVAGGIGLAPLRPVVEEVLSEREAFGRVAVVVGARSPSDLLFREDLERWSARLDVDVAVTVDHADVTWRGEVGVVTELLERLPVAPENTTAFVCGPEIMMRFAAAALGDLGVAPSRIRISLERNMKCAIAHCGHCQLGPTLVCREGPVYPFEASLPLLAVRGL